MNACRWSWARRSNYTKSAPRRHLVRKKAVFSPMPWTVLQLHNLNSLLHLRRHRRRSVSRNQLISTPATSMAKKELVDWVVACHVTKAPRAVCLRPRATCQTGCIISPMPRGPFAADSRAANANRPPDWLQRPLNAIFDSSRAWKNSSWKMGRKNGEPEHRYINSRRRLFLPSQNFNWLCARCTCGHEIFIN